MKSGPGQPTPCRFPGRCLKSLRQPRRSKRLLSLPRPQNFCGAPSTYPGVRGQHRPPPSPAGSYKICPSVEEGASGGGCLKGSLPSRHPLPKRSSLTSLAAFSPSSRRFLSIILLLSTAALSSALSVQPILGRGCLAPPGEVKQGAAGLGAGSGGEALRRERERVLPARSLLSPLPHLGRSGVAGTARRSRLTAKRGGSEREGRGWARPGERGEGTAGLRTGGPRPRTGAAAPAAGPEAAARNTAPAPPEARDRARTAHAGRGERRGAGSACTAGRPAGAAARAHGGGEAFWGGGRERNVSGAGNGGTAGFERE